MIGKHKKMAEIFQETKRYLHKKNNKKENSKTRQNKAVKTPPPNKRKKKRLHFDFRHKQIACVMCSDKMETTLCTHAHVQT